MDEAFGWPYEPFIRGRISRQLVEAPFSQNLEHRAGSVAACWATSYPVQLKCPTYLVPAPAVLNRSLVGRAACPRNPWLALLFWTNFFGKQRKTNKQTKCPKPKPS